MMGEIEIIDLTPVSTYGIYTSSCWQISNDLDIRAYRGQKFRTTIAKETGPISPFRVGCPQTHFVPGI